MDPRKPVHRPDNAAQDEARNIAYSHLLAVTEVGAKAVGCTGASFVVMGLGIWAAELAELDARNTSRMLHALADLYDPASNDTKRIKAEKKRRAAVLRLFAAVDLDMAEPGGRA
ncbi:hypothetical protein EMVG_00038 [Emiliania huxleyi virus PS401]|nr:hypothetical protein EMVG_00038 [Emiliania huxleyi virus PS401]